MDNAERLEKNKRISQSKQDTLTRRESQSCHVFKIKIDQSQLNKRQKEDLTRLFLEAKWLVNHILNWAEGPDNHVWKFDSKIKKVSVKNKDGQKETRELKVLSSQMKQSIVDEMSSNIRTLSTLKKHGHKIGRLNFRKEVKSINLKQFGMTYKVCSSKRIKIQGVTGKLPVNGLRQIDLDTMELANAKLLNTPRGYYLAITCWVKKESEERREFLPEIGVDMGCSTSLTLSTGEKINVRIGETERLKRLQRKAARQLRVYGKTSNGRAKTISLIRKEYQKIGNRKDDAANKVVHDLLEHERVYIQDENLRGWKASGHGRAVQRSVLGRVKVKLVVNPRVVVLDRMVPTTKVCHVCGAYHPEIALSDRVFRCSCGVEMDRDVHAALNMVVLGKNPELVKRNVGVGCTEVKRVETESSISPAQGPGGDNFRSTKHEGPGSSGQD